MILSNNTRFILLFFLPMLVNSFSGSEAPPFPSIHALDWFPSRHHLSLLPPLPSPNGHFPQPLSFLPSAQFCPCADTPLPLPGACWVSALPQALNPHRSYPGWGSALLTWFPHTWTPSHTAGHLPAMPGFSLPTPSPSTDTCLCSSAQQECSSMWMLSLPAWVLKPLGEPRTDVAALLTSRADSLCQPILCGNPPQPVWLGHATQSCHSGWMTTLLDFT